jgi:hypothetical protein
MHLDTLATRSGGEREIHSPLKLSPKINHPAALARSVVAAPPRHRRRTPLKHSNGASGLVAQWQNKGWRCGGRQKPSPGRVETTHCPAQRIRRQIEIFLFMSACEEEGAPHGSQEVVVQATLG